MILSCQAEPCTRKPVAKGVCMKHYVQLRRYGEFRETNYGKYEDRTLYYTWRDMKARCLKPNHKDYRHYGGRGITICERWLSKDGYKNFCADMGHRPSREFSLDRVNNDGGYSPENCRWATKSEQMRNRRQSTRKLTLCSK